MAIVGVLGFSFKAILIKLAYAWAPIDAVTLLALRMIYATPIFLLMALWSTRGRGTPPMVRRDWMAILWLGFIGYYLASLLDFMGLQYVTAALERLMLYLYPTIVVVISATTNLFRYWYPEGRVSSRTGRLPAGFGRSAHQTSYCVMP